MSGLARIGAPGRHVYDVIVVGTQLSGLLAGALLAKRGCAVLLAPVSTEPQEYELDQLRLPSLPDVFEPALSIPLLAEVAAELALTQILQREVPLMAPQIILPRQRIALSTDAAKTEKELARVWPGEAAAIQARWNKARSVASADDAAIASRPPIPAAGWWSRFLMNRRLKRLEWSGADFALNPAHALDAAVTKMISHLGIADAALSRSRVLARSFDALSVLPSGPAGLESLVRNRAREIGADVTDLATTSLVFEGSAPIGIRLARNDTTFRAPVVIAACDTASLIPLLPEERQRKAHQAWPENSAKHHFTVHAIIEPSAVPPGLADLALVPTDSDLGSVLITVAPVQRIDGKPTDDLRISMSSQVPSAVIKGGAPTIKATAERMWAAVDGVLPFVRKTAKRESVVASDAEKTTRTALSAPAENGVLGVTRYPIETPFNRLLLSNREVVPGLNLEGDVLAGLRVVERIEKLLKRQQKGKTS